jgi:mRNA-degrading endonuclease RelE of RelBE toxin-antitoxin system
MGILLAI